MPSSSLNQLRALTRLPSWWQQLGWMVGTEVVIGLLAGWGWGQGLAIATIVRGLATICAVEALLLWGGSRLGRPAATVALVAIFIALAASLNTSGVSQWFLLCFSFGIINGFAYLQGIRALTWVSVSARRRGGHAGQALVLATLISGFILALSIIGAGWIAAYWNHLPQAVLIFIAVVLLPIEWRHTRRRGAPLAPMAPMQWWIGTTSIFNAMGAVGRRFVAPMVILATAAASGQESKGLAWVGSVMGLTGLFGLAVRQVWQHWRQKGHHHAFGLRRPFFLGISGSLLIGAGLIGWQTSPRTGWLALMGAGWLIYEVVNRVWTVAHYEAMRLAACHGQPNAQRAYREAVARMSMVRALCVGSTYGVASFLTMGQIGALLMALGLAALIFFEWRPAMRAALRLPPE